jgi:hypothetical protein
VKNANTYEVVWPRGSRFQSDDRLAKRLDTLEGKVVCGLWDWVFKGDVILEAFEKELAKRYPGIKFVSWREFGEIHGAHEKEVLAALPGKLRQFNCDAVICGVGC